VTFEIVSNLLPVSKLGKLADLRTTELLTKVLNANVLPQRLEISCQANSCILG
jgi:hypothetical protein